ncbi:hypothetical protein [Roseivirga spongicola]|nr:hypothetical protein [Roseivirga spongicola]WPZ11754.1 hypothetical protein T7867_06490 [Roseivirga spongicola]
MNTVIVIGLIFGLTLLIALWMSLRHKGPIQLYMDIKRGRFLLKK